VLLANMHRTGLNPTNVEAIVLSHIHTGHTGGLDELLAEHADLEVLFGNVWSTGKLRDRIIEQALILDTAKDLVVVTGCAHPGIDRIAETAVRLIGIRIQPLMGGFHLGRTGRAESQAIIAGFRRSGWKRSGNALACGAA
jgi:7,8-dihydropterin-6-yl-methyl-4-(beta-D-ribofuranosyl)aminobenzene 5'-phosphate synthase